MLRSITWIEFFECIGLFAIIYYAIIGWMYKENLKAWLARKKIIRSPNPASFRSDANDSEEMDAYSYHNCFTEITAFFEKAKERKWVKEEMMYSLQLILKKYTSLQLSSEKQSIEKVISGLAENLSSLHLHDEDMNQLWLG